MSGDSLGFTLDLNVSPYERALARATDDLKKFSKEGKKSVKEVETETDKLWKSFQEGADSSKTIEGWAGSLGAMANPAALAAAAVTAIGTAAIAATAAIVGLGTGLGAWMSSVAAEAEQVKGAFDFAFQGMEASGEAFVTNLSNEIHRSGTEIAATMTQIGLAFADLDFPVDQTEAFSENLTAVTYDLAALKNQDPSAVAAKLTKALQGSAGAARSLGIDMSKAAVNQELLSMGLEGGAAAASEQDKAVARLQIILRETSDTAGQAASQIETFTGIVDAVTGKAKDLANVFGDEINKAIEETVKSFGGLDTINEILKITLDTAKEITIAVVQMAGEVVSWVARWIKSMGGAETIHWKVVAVIEQLRRAYYQVELAVKLVAGVLYTVYRATYFPVFTTMKNMVLDIGDAIGVVLVGQLSFFSSQLATLMHKSAKLIPGAWGDSLEETAGEIDQWVGVMDGYTAGWEGRATARAEETLTAWTGIAKDIQDAWSDLDLESSVQGAIRAGAAAKIAWDNAAASAARYNAVVQDGLTSLGQSAYTNMTRGVNYEVQGNGTTPKAASGATGGSGSGGGAGGSAGGASPGGWGDYSNRYRDANGNYTGGYNYGGSTSSGGGMGGDGGVQWFARGGIVQGPRTGTDSVPAMLTPGERVLTPQENRRYEQGNRTGASLTVHNHFPNVTQVTDEAMERALAPQYARLRRAGVKI